MHIYKHRSYDMAAWPDLTHLLPALEVAESLGVLDGFLASLVSPSPHDVDCGGGERGLDVRC
jgi:hypothetical protein